jgi:uncharacterized protein (DUF2147 family)
MRSFILCVALLIVTGGSTRAQGTDVGRNAILGEWLTAGGESRVEISLADSVSVTGKIIWLRDPLKEGKPVLDDKNPEESLRGRPVLGLVLLRGFSYDGDGEWVGGRIYDPKSGNDYSAKMKLVDEKNLDLRGYVLVPLFGRTERWTRP